MRVKTLLELSAALDDMTRWRNHELVNLRSFFISGGKSANLVALKKSALLLIYAHWEGAVKDMSGAYLSHIEQQKILRAKLKPAILALASLKAIRQASFSNKILPYEQVVDYIVNSGSHTYKLPNIKLIDTESNLSTTVLKNILMSVGLHGDVGHFEDKERFIDVALLATRNDIAHNGASSREEMPVDQIIDGVLHLILTFRNAVENGAATKLYLV